MIDLNYREVGSLRQQMECLAVLLSKMLASAAGGELPLMGV